MAGQGHDEIVIRGLSPLRDFCGLGIAPAPHSFDGSASLLHYGHNMVQLCAKLFGGSSKSTLGVTAAVVRRITLAPRAWGTATPPAA
jgi:hypothetical protein